jgi:hypothetical protein
MQDILQEEFDESAGILQVKTKEAFEAFRTTRMVSIVRA